MASHTGSLYNIFVRNLPWTIGSNELKKNISKFGPIVTARVIFDRETGLSKRFGFIETNDRDTQQILLNQKNYYLEGNKLIFQLHKS